MISLFLTHNDPSGELLYEEVKTRNLPVRKVYYDEIGFVKGELFYDGSPLSIAQTEKMILRWPWEADNPAIEYNIVVKALISAYKEHIVLDLPCLEAHTPFYEDKLYQSNIFQQNKFKSPDTYFFPSFDLLKANENLFPLVLKKRLSSRSKGNFLVKNIEEVKHIVDTKNISLQSVIFQKPVSIAHDLRILILKGEILGIVDRQTHVREENRLSVKGMSVYENCDPQIISEAMRLAKEIGADLAGIDALLNANGDYFFIEANLSPQYVTFTETTNISVAKRVIDSISL